MQQLLPEIAKAVEKLNEGEVSPAFTLIDEKGREVCAIVRLKKRVPGHKATITEDYQNLRDLVLSKKREEILHNWILNKQKETYIHINEDWKDCDFKYPGWVKE